MRHDEAARIFSILDKFPAHAITPCLNLGSQTKYYRETHKAHIHNNLFLPLQRKGVQVIHADLQSGEGIDVSGDFMESAVQEKLLSLQPRLVLCNNMFEHVSDRQQLAEVLMKLANGGHLLLSVPYSYPYHPDPIDTLFRPTPEQLGSLFEDCKVEHAEILVSDTFLSDQRRRRKGLVKTFFRIAMRLFFPFYKPRHWLSNLHRLAWMKRPYKVSLLLLSVRGEVHT